MSGKCEYAIWRRDVGATTCKEPASWRYAEKQGQRTGEFCDKHADVLGCCIPNQQGSWERIVATLPEGDRHE